MKLIPQASAPPQKMYRHFAVVTLSVTLILAVFAHGESGKSAQAISPAAAAEPVQPVKKKATLTVKADGPIDSGGWGEASDSEFASLGDNGFVSHLQSLQAQFVPASYKGHMVSDALLATLSPEERNSLLRQMQDSRSASSIENHRNDIAALEAASAARAGGNSVD